MTERKADRVRRLARERKRRERRRKRGEPEPTPAGLPSTSTVQPSPAVELAAAPWCEANLVTASGPRKGEPWRWHKWQRRIVEAIDGRTTVIVAAAQSGKTSIGLGTLAHRLARGAPCMVAAPDSDRSGLTLARRRLEALIACCPVLASSVQETRATRLGQSGRVSLRTFDTGGSYAIVGAQSPAQLSSLDVSTLLADELARWPADCGGEGDPVPLALARLDAFEAARTAILMSTPVLPGDHAAEWLDAGDVRRWHVPCECGHAWAPEWKHIDPEAVAIICPSCGRSYADGAERLAFLDRGEWQATRPAADADVVSYHLPRWLSPASTLRGCLAARTRALRQNKLATWRRLVAAEPCEADVLLDTTDIRNRLVPEDSSWPPSTPKVCVSAVDVQRNRVEVAHVAMMPSGVVCLLDYERLYGRPVLPEDDVWRRLRQSVTDHGSRLAVCDAGYATDSVRSLMQRDARFVGTVGRSGERASIEPGRTGLFVLGVDTLKATIYERIAADTLLLPAAPWADDHFLRGVIAETEQTTPDGKRKWVKVYTRNEPLDTLVMALAGLELVRLAGPRRRRMTHVA